MHNMNSVFTHFIRSLDSPDAPPEMAAFEALLDELRWALIWKLKRRFLWSASPAYLGVYGSSSWSDPGALDELLVDCYEFIFIDRRRALRAQLELVENIDGLVSRNINNFLYELQKRHDPLGFRIFTALKTATLSAIETQTLHIVLGSQKITNQTILGFAPGSDPGGARDEAQGSDLSRSVQVWNDDLLPDLITADGKARRRLLVRLERHISQLSEQGIEAFQFGKLLNPLKADARERWSTIWDSTAGESVIEPGGEGLLSKLRLARPDTDFEKRDAFQKLLACMSQAIAQVDEPARTRMYLERLWVFLRHHAADSLVA